MTRDDWKQYEKIARDDKVLIAQRARCEEQGHDWENGCTAMFQIVQVCKWCGEFK